MVIMDNINFPLAGTGVPQLNHQQQRKQQQQPPQIFGAFGPDGLPQVPHLPPDYSGAIFTDSQSMFDDSQDAKRRRIARACDMCRKKKIKCDGKMPACTQCINYKTDCVFTQVEKKRSPPKGAKYIEGLENRLSRMEKLLKLSGLLAEGEETDLGSLERKLMEQNQKSQQPSVAGSSTPVSPTLTNSVLDGTASSPQSTDAKSDLSKDRGSFAVDDTRKLSIPLDLKAKDDDEEQVELLSEMMCSLVTTQSGETRYIGSSSGFSIFSPKGIEWVNAKTGDGSFQNMISEVSIDDHKWTSWKTEVFSDVFRRPVYRPLPPKDQALSLLQDYFENFNCMFPLFHQPTFMHLVERQYSSDPYQGSGWWASLNCALAISHRLRVMSNLGSEDEDAKAWGHMKNALGVYAELTMRNTDLLSVQALVGIALFMQGTPNPQPSFLVIAAAIRLAHTIGLHKRGTGFNLNPVEIEQRKRVFWIAYLLDKDLCLRSGRPPAQDDDDMNVELPDADPADCIGNIPLADGIGKMNLFRVMCEFSIIESNVYKRLYSTKASKQSNGELLTAIGELDQELENWKDSIPIDFRPENPIQASHTPLILHVVMLHFAYYNCLNTIHRMSVHHGFWTSRLSNYALRGLNTRALNPRVYTSASVCTQAARASIALLQYIPQGDYNCVWMILYFPVSALMTLFANIINNPLDPKAKGDNRLMATVVTFLSRLGQEAEQGGVHRMLGVCSEFERIAAKVIEKAEREPRRKRKNQDTSASLTKPETAGTPTPTIGTSTASEPSRSAASFGSQTQRTDQSSATSATTLAASSTTGAAPINAPGGNINDPSSVKAGDRQGSSNGAESERFNSGSPPVATAVDWPQGFSMSEDNVFGSLNESIGLQPGFGSPPQGSEMSYSQPLLPQDLFSLPMSLDWNWAELSGGAYPTVENGMFGEGTGDQQHRGQRQK